MPLKVVPKSSPIMSWSSVPWTLNELTLFRNSSNKSASICYWCFAPDGSEKYHSADGRKVRKVSIYGVSRVERGLLFVCTEIVWRYMISASLTPFPCGSSRTALIDNKWSSTAGCDDEAG